MPNQKSEKTNKRNLNYNINQSPFYKLQSKRRLSFILNMSLHDIVALIKKGAANYSVYTLQPKALVSHPLFRKKEREVQELKPNLKRAHRRIYDLLRRIEVPEYLHSAVKGKSYASNARHHAFSSCLYKIDIKSFYKNVKWKTIYLFFLNVLKCSADVAYILSEICCYNNMIPTGSCLSPILSFHVNRKMFDALYRYACNNDLKMTVYVDDIVFSGELISKRMCFEIDSIIRANRYTPHKQKLYNSGVPKIITGLVVNNGKVDIPNKRRAKLRIAIGAIRNTNDEILREKLCRTLLGMVYEMKQFNPSVASFAAADAAKICDELRERLLNFYK